MDDSKPVRKLTPLIYKTKQKFQDTPLVDAYDTQGGFPYYKLDKSNPPIYMWWMWHPGDVGHWVVNETPGNVLRF